MSWYVIRCGTQWPLKLLVRILIENTDWCSARLGVLPSLKFEAFNALQWPLVLPKKGRRLWDPFTCERQHFVKSNILSKPWMGSALSEKTNYLITMSEDVIWGPEVNWRPSVHQSGWMVHWWFHFFIPMFTKLVNTRWHFFPMLNPNPNFCLVWTSFPSPLPTHIHLLLLNSPPPPKSSLTYLFSNSFLSPPPSLTYLPISCLLLNCFAL